MAQKQFIKRVKFVLSNPVIYFQIIYYKLICFIEKIKGLDFTKTESIQELNLPVNSWGYESSGNKYLENIINDFKVSKSDSFLDIGCGKANVLYRLCKFSFGKIQGVELSKRLSDVARKNMSILKKNNVIIWNTNATEFRDYGTFNYIYMYNPFQCDVMTEVIREIENSLIANPRNVTIIYKNPLCHENLIKNGIFKKIMEYPSEYDHIKFFIYQNET